MESLFTYFDFDASQFDLDSPNEKKSDDVQEGLELSFDVSLLQKEMGISTPSTQSSSPSIPSSDTSIPLNRTPSIPISKKSTPYHSPPNSRSNSWSNLSSPKFSSSSSSSSIVRHALGEVFFVSSFATHQVKTIASGIYNIATKGHVRPTWDLMTSFGLHFLRQNLQFPHHSVERARLRSVVSNDKHKGVTITVDKNKLLKYEALGAHYRRSTSAYRYPVPPEERHHDHECQYPLKGEWFDPPQPSNKTILYLHGGAYVVGSISVYRSWLQKLANETGCRLFAIDYRLSPEHPFPAALHDAFAAYLWLIDPLNEVVHDPSHTPISPHDIVLMGDSAGGGLCMSLLNYLNLYTRHPNGDLLIPMPQGAVLYSPWVDLSCSSNSWEENKDLDWLPPNASDIHSMLGSELVHPVYSYCLGEDVHRPLTVLSPTSSQTFTTVFSYQTHVNMYESRRDAVERFVRHPLVSPIYAESFKGLPPILIQAGECEVLRDESIALAYKYASTHPQGWVRHELYKDMVHVFQAGTWLPSAQLAQKYLVNFLIQVFELDRDLVQILEHESNLIKSVDSHVFT